MAINPTEELLAAPLPDLISNLGIAVAKANKALMNNKESDIAYTIPSAEIEIKVAISIDKSSSTSVGGSLNLQAFNVNASYKNTYGFKEEASSRIKLIIQAKPRESSQNADAQNPPAIKKG